MRAKRVAREARDENVPAKRADFFAFFWNNSQTHAFLKVAEEGPVSLELDASVQIIKPIRKLDGPATGPIFHT